MFGLPSLLDAPPCLVVADILTDTLEAVQHCHSINMTLRGRLLKPAARLAQADLLDPMIDQGVISREKVDSQNRELGGSSASQASDE